MGPRTSLLDHDYGYCKPTPSFLVAPSLPSQGIKKFFTPATKLKNGRKTPPTAPTQALDVITIDDDDEEAAKPTPENNNKERSMSIILFDDVSSD